MPIKIEENRSAVAHHIVDGPVPFPYAVDAHSAVSRFPLEWSAEPWTQEREAEARARLNEQRQAENQPPLPAPTPLSPEDQAAIDEHNAAVKAAADRLAEYRKKKEEEAEIARQVAADEALVASPPPRPDPTIRRPFGRKGDPTPAERAAFEKKQAADAAAKKAADDKLVADKAEADRIANAMNHP
jgi:colicin import membrane protein